LSSVLYHITPLPTRRSSDRNIFTSIGEVDFLFHLQEKPAKPDYDPGDQQPNTENPPYRYAQGDKEQVILDYGVRDGQVVVQQFGDRKSTRLHSSHVKISYAV